MGQRRKRPDSGVKGCLIVDKPSGCTSHDVIDRVRKSLGTRKVGHAGTLDPDATGVLVLGVGTGTKLLEFVVGADKEYETEICFGVETSTLDSSGEVTNTFEMNIEPEQVSEMAKKFVGDIEQIPPMVSAIKVDGKRLHELAREGIEIEREPRKVHVSRYDTSPTDKPLIFSAVIECSSGTYVRSLAADLGASLGGGAHIQNLKRNRVGTFLIKDAVKLDDVSADVLRPVKDLLSDMPIIEVGGDVEKKVLNGQSLSNPPGVGQIGVCNESGSLLAVYETVGDFFKPVKVLPQ